MKLGRALLSAWCIGAIAGGCTSDLELALGGKRCKNERCVTGYKCDLATSVCILVDTLPSAGTGGGRSNNSTGGSGSGPAGRGGDGGAGGGGGDSTLAGQGGRGGSVAGAAGEDLDAGASDPTDAGDACVIGRIYRDRDNDGFGDVSDAKIGCPGNGYVTNDEDCRDDLPEVRPNQAAFFRVGYPISGDTVSFDYDCSKTEEPSPENETLEPAPTCGGLGLVNCMGSGFLPAEPSREGPGVEPRCGSTLRRDCEFDGPLSRCESVDTPLSDELTFECH